MPNRNELIQDGEEHQILHHIDYDPKEDSNEPVAVDNTELRRTWTREPERIRPLQVKDDLLINNPELFKQVEEVAANNYQYDTTQWRNLLSEKNFLIGTSDTLEAILEVAKCKKPFTGTFARTLLIDAAKKLGLHIIIEDQNDSHIYKVMGVYKDPNIIFEHLFPEAIIGEMAQVYEEIVPGITPYLEVLYTDIRVKPLKDMHSNKEAIPDDMEEAIKWYCASQAFNGLLFGYPIANSQYSTQEYLRRNLEKGYFHENIEFLRKLKREGKRLDQTNDIWLVPPKYEGKI